MLGSDIDNEIFGAEGDDYIEGNAGNDRLDGNQGIDTLKGGDGNDVIFGGEGDDWIEGGAGDVYLHGWSGKDLIDYWGAASRVIVNLLQNYASSVATGSDYVTEIEDVRATDFDDIIDGNHDANDLLGLEGNDQIRGHNGNDTLYGHEGNDLLWGDAGNDQVFGGIGNDELRGGLGNDTLLAGADNDVLLGEGGGDILNGEVGTDTASYATSTALVKVALDNSIVFVGDALGDTFVSIENLSGSNFGDTLVGNAGANTITGLAGHDAIFGMSGNDTLNGGLGIDTMMGGDGNDTYVSDVADIITETNAVAATGGIDTILSSATRTLGLNIENLTLAGAAIIDGTGNTLNNVLTGNTVANTLKGAAGKDVLDGLAGLDTADYSDKTLAVVATLNGAVAVNVTVGGIIEDSIKNIENLIGGTAADTLTGDNLANILNGGADALADQLRGGLGNDTYIINSINDNIVELVGGGIADRAKVSLSFALAARDNIEFLETTNAAGVGLINLTGNEIAQSITGNAGANTLNGGIDALADTLIGGLGIDTYIINSTTDNIVELVGGGTADRAKSSLSFALVAGDNIEFLETTNAALTTLINLTGNEIVQTITGNNGANVLKGAGGKDVLDGLAGLDTADFSDKTLAIVATLNGAVAVNVTVGGVVEDSIRNIENLIGGTAADKLTGDGLANILNGGADAVADTLAGGLGSDIYIINSANDIITEVVGQGTDRVQASVTFTLGVGDSIEFLETVNAALTSLINLTGNELSQIITGNAGANILNGGVDNLADSLVGGLGNDTYIINSAADNITELAGGGTADRAKASVTFTLAVGDNIEFLETTNAALATLINLSGNEFAQTITGNAGANVLNGGIDGLTDVLVGGLGNDTYIINSSNDLIT